MAHRTLLYRLLWIPLDGVLCIHQIQPEPPSEFMGYDDSHWRDLCPRFVTKTGLRMAREVESST
jgi:hypothetical protein